MPLLNPGDTFPRLTIPTTDNQALTLPDAFAGDFGAVLFGYGADAAAVAALTRAFVNPDPVYLQSTGFVLDPAENVAVSVYSSGAIGRLFPDDVVSLARYLREHTAPATA